MEIYRGDAYWVDLDKIFPNGKHYQKGVRPCIVISNNKNNLNSDMINIMPLTTQKDYLPQHCTVYLNYNKNFCLPEQITVIDKKYLTDKCGFIGKNMYKQVERALEIQFGLCRRNVYDK